MLRKSMQSFRVNSQKIGSKEKLHLARCEGRRPGMTVEMRANYNFMACSTMRLGIDTESPAAILLPLFQILWPIPVPQLKAPAKLCGAPCKISAP